MTLKELIVLLQDFQMEHGDDIKVIRSDNSGGCEAIYQVYADAAIERNTQKETVAIVIGE